MFLLSKWSERNFLTKSNTQKSITKKKINKTV